MKICRRSCSTLNRVYSSFTSVSIDWASFTLMLRLSASSLTACRRVRETSRRSVASRSARGSVLGVLQRLFTLRSRRLPLMVEVGEPLSLFVRLTLRLCKLGREPLLLPASLVLSLD